MLAVTLAAAILFARQQATNRNEAGDRHPAPAGSDAAGAKDVIAEAYRARRSGFVVEGAGVVETILRDDTAGSRHQRFILRLESGLTLLVSHNIDVSPRVRDLAMGDRVDFRGQYEWNDRGGLIHWTHRDPARRRPGGWLRHRGRVYR